MMRIDAKRAIAEVRHRADDHSRIGVYRAYIPAAAGSIIGDPLDISRQNLVKELQDGMRTVTITWNGSEWVEGAEVRLTKNGYVRTDHDDTDEDNLGELPEITGPLLRRI